MRTQAIGLALFTLTLSALPGAENGSPAKAPPAVPAVPPPGGVPAPAAPNGAPPPPFPGFGFRPEPATQENFQRFIQAPEGFDVTLFAAPPQVTYPVAVAAGVNGEVYVGVDEQGSLGRTPGGGRVLKCVDTDGDGKADKVTVFARMEHPRGVVAEGGSVWVMNPPNLTVYQDLDGDGVADREEVLVTGLTTDLITNRGGDHTTNGIRMGIDGWIYICSGDYGIRQARGKDGTVIVHRGGEILRVRPDGTELEIFATGLRNPFDIAIDPYLDFFTRDNTNDGGGWDTRISQVFQSAHYGYTQLYANFPEETMPPLGVFGNGGGTGALFVQDPRWPEGFANNLFTGDWGRSEVYLHPLKKSGPTFALEQNVFLKIPRPTGMDLSADGRLYLASWKGGEASVFTGPTVGFIARISPHDLKPAPLPDLQKLSVADLVDRLANPAAVTRLQGQQEILSRGRNPEATDRLVKLASDAGTADYGRVAALFTLKQLDGRESHPALVKLADDPAVREFALRALTDRKTQLEGVNARPFLAALTDGSPRVRAQAVISLGRLKAPEAASALLPLATQAAASQLPTQQPVHAQPDPHRVIPHLAMQALIALNAVEPCLGALDGPDRPGALLVLRTLHQPRVVEGLIARLETTTPAAQRREILSALIRLYYREADYTGSWWGIRPESIGPYYDNQEWELTRQIRSAISAAARKSDPEELEFLRKELARHQVSLDDPPALAANAPGRQEAELQKPIVIARPMLFNPDVIGALPYELAASRALMGRGNAQRGKLLFTAQSCSACHTDADGQKPKGPHLVEIGKRSTPEQLVESILKPSAKIAQGYESWTFELKEGDPISGFVASENAQTISVREVTGIVHEIKRANIAKQTRSEASTMPEGIVGNLTPEQLADLLAYLQSLEKAK